MGAEPYIPSPEGLNADFYAHAAGGTLHLQRCASCGRFRHPPRFHCPDCSSDRCEWVASPGRGQLYSWTVTHRPFDRGWADRLPYATGVIELAEGVRLIGALEGVGHDELAIGLPLVARLSPRGDEFTFISLCPDHHEDSR